MTISAVFLDLDGVINDHERLPAAYVRLLGDVLSPALGGEAADWGRANSAVFPDLFREMLAIEASREEVERWELTENVRRMCTWLGIEPPSAGECYRLGREATLYVRRNGDFIIPGSGEAIRDLAADFDLHMATGNPSWTTRANLDQLGVSDLFGLLCGPDLIGTLKWNDDFYKRLLTSAGVDPSTAVVVDDGVEALAKARAAGARTIHVHENLDEADLNADATIRSIRELPKTIRGL